MNVKAAAVDDFGGLDTPIRYELRYKNIGGKDEDRSLAVVEYLVIMLGLQVLQQCDVDNSGNVSTHGSEDFLKDDMIGRVFMVLQRGRLFCRKRL